MVATLLRPSVHWHSSPLTARSRPSAESTRKDASPSSTEDVGPGRAAPPRAWARTASTIDPTRTIEMQAKADFIPLMALFLEKTGCHGHCSEWPCLVRLHMPTPSRGHGTPDVLDADSMARVFLVGRRVRHVILVPRGFD